MKQYMKHVIASRKTSINCNSTSKVRMAIAYYCSYYGYDLGNNPFLITNSAHNECDTSNMISSGSEVHHKKSQVECRSISFVNSGFLLPPWKMVEYIWVKENILLALGLNMKYSTLKRVSREYCTQFS